MSLFGRFGVAVLTCIWAICFPIAYADIPLSKYSEFRENVPQFENYLVGVGRGIFYANVLLATQGKPKLFCMPKKLALDKDIILSLIDQEIRNPPSGKPFPKETTVEMVMAFSIARRFPCKP